jgi:hypothetical protein
MSTPSGGADLTVADLREEFGVGAPKLTMPGLEWDETREGHFREAAHEQGWEPALVQSMMRDYVDRVPAPGGRTTPDLVDEFHAKYKGKLSQAERDGLVRWLTEGTS